jgi:hypothetical protein
VTLDSGIDVVYGLPKPVHDVSLWLPDVRTSVALWAGPARPGPAHLASDPAYPDSAYYVDVARSLHAGQGFNVDFVWIFAEVGGTLPVNPVLPIPSNAHWMPLASIVQVRSGRVRQWRMGIGGAVCANRIGRGAIDLGDRTRRRSDHSPRWALGVLVAIPLLSTMYMAQPDNFSLYQHVAGSLWMAARGLRGSGRSFVLAGLLAGLATRAATTDCWSSRRWPCGRLGPTSRMAGSRDGRHPAIARARRLAPSGSSS